MTQPQTSAKIYQFPVRSRISSAPWRPETRQPVDMRAAQQPVIVYGGGWYHDEAIEDARRNGKH